ncbi:protein-export chaperone SecB [Cytobacillus firmus]|uniref:protein-export chaperone SecB n=1 Tax=Cytobacillus firmus TaxID=1399 RepID=UPI0018CC996E|nr:protein-export chaperone SecB [Cytobacillus firmus]MBG9656282.1 hypothetical protein [Cytobacillus firmus]MED1904564.1 protein-export chaperone SecB [Cytobacillus firmus]
MKEIVSFLKFNDYSIKDFVFKRNRNFVTDDKNIDIEFEFKADAAFSDDKSMATILLICEIFDEESFSNGNSPFYLKVELEGFFSCSSDIKIDEFELNGIAIVLPYLRAFITSFTAQASIPPVIIPPINVYNLIKNKDKH